MTTREMCLRAVRMFVHVVVVVIFFFADSINTQKNAYEIKILNKIREREKKKFE